MTQVFEDVACTVCGCLCDDLTIRIDDGRVASAEGACALSEPWLLTQSTAEGFSAQIGNAPVGQSEAVAEAAKILGASRAPLVYGLSTSSTPGQRAACRLADQLGATIDTTASTCHAPSILAVQAVGESTSSLGEVRNRADVVVYWGSNPLKSHPRHLERYVESPGMFVPGGRSDRQLIVVDVQRTATADVADQFVEVTAGSDFDVLWALRSILKGVELKEQSVGGVLREELLSLAETFRSCRYGAMFFGLGLTRHGVPQANVEALLRLVTDLNHHTRFIARRMRIPGDVAGADSVLCWQTGFPFSVNLSRGYPRYNPGEYTANNLLEQNEVDCVVLVGSEGVEKLSPLARQHLAQIPTIVLDNPGVECALAATVHFTTAIYGIHRAGTAYRMDEVPIPLRGILESPLPSDDEILKALSAALFMV
ncbi:MAG: formylmethanofuran dehydrogenase subunit B [Planctomycetes bacterium]|nr:formylmethanofuran dehydrogenase subunit B [Planctomycetota bacterium]